MNYQYRSWVSIVGELLGLACLGWMFTRPAASQAEDRSPMGLIRFITYQTADRPKLPVIVFTCGVTADSLADRAAVRALVMQGPAALPALDEAIGSLEQRGNASPFFRNFYFLLYAYAKIKGPSAVPSLRALNTNTDLRQDFALTIDEAIALSLGLTDYVTQSERSVRVLRCDTGGYQPRDGLSQLILGWERDDRSWMEGSLGPNSTTALSALLKGRSWAEFRSELWPAKLEGPVSVGYRFAIQSPWSEPSLSLLVRQGEFAPEPPPQVSEPALDTHFTNREGGACGSLAVTFVQAPPTTAGPVIPAFLVNQSDLGGLLRLIGICAAQ
jgi:hypothetical protein